MTIPASLFVEAPEVQDRSLTRLNSDMNAWPEEIIQKLRERAPQTASLSCMVKFQKKDEENGTATGSVVITTPESAIIVPIIIKDFTLYPLDVMIAKSKILPLTPDYLQEAISRNQVFDRIEEYPTYGGLGRFEDANLWNAVYPPSLGRYAYASAGYPMLDLISDNLDGTTLKEWLKANPAHAVGFHKNGHSELLKKVANLKPVNMNEFKPGADNLIPRNVRMLMRESPNKYTLLSSNDKVFSPAFEHLDRGCACNFLSTISDCVQDDINEVDQNGEKVLLLPPPAPGAVLAQTDTEIPESADHFDHYSVKKKNGVSVVGMVIPKVIDFDQEPVKLKLFLGKTMSTMQPEIWGVRLKNNRFQPIHSNPRVGQTGTFMYQPDQSHALATVPVTIKTICEDAGVLTIAAMDLLGRQYNLKVNPAMGLKRIAKTPDKYYMLPKEMKWVVMEEFGEVTSSPADYAVKTAGSVLTDRPVKIIPTGYDQYSVKGLGKYAQAAGWDATNLSRPQVKFLLTCLGAPQEKIAALFEQGRRSGQGEIHNLNFLPTVAEKIAEFRPKAAKLVKSAGKIKRTLFKEASYIDSAQTVDALLSLNFVTPDNISKFVGKIPHFKATISNLASTLLGCRLGIKELPEEACAVAMQKLIEVVDGLERLRASQEVQPS